MHAEYFLQLAKDSYFDADDFIGEMYLLLKKGKLELKDIGVSQCEIDSILYDKECIDT